MENRNDTGKLTATEMTVFLRGNDVTVHLVQSDTFGNLNVFLGANHGQREVAQSLIETLPEVVAVRCAAPGVLRVIYVLTSDSR